MNTIAKEEKEMYVAWIEMWEYVYTHPVRSLLIATGVCVAVTLVYYGGVALVRHIRFRRWADRQVWYISGSGQLYQKDHTRDCDREEYK